MSRTIKAAPTFKPGGAAGDEAGVVLLMVILVLALVSVLVLSWAQEWQLELRLAANFRESQQCRRLAQAGFYYALGKVTLARQTQFQGPMGARKTQSLLDQPAEAWPLDQTPKQLELPEGLAVVRVGDEGGKLNLNQAPELSLIRLFVGAGYGESQARVMAESIIDWRSQGEQASPYGAKSAFYLQLTPPYVAKCGKFEVAEELAWVHGFEGCPLIPRLGDWLTAQGTASAVNINTAPLEVLQALGFSPDVASSIIAARRERPFTNFMEIAGTAQLLPDQFSQMTFQPLPFFTIKSTGMINKKGGRHTLKALVQLTEDRDHPWNILAWMDDFPD